MRVDVGGCLAVIDIVLRLCFLGTHGKARPDDLVRLNTGNEQGKLVRTDLVCEIRVWELASTEIVEVASLSGQCCQYPPILITALKPRT